MHTLVLTTLGRVYSWGCNDEAALGREGAENVPLQVDNSLEYPMTNIVAGDCHSIAYNTTLNLIYRWGLYRNALTGKIGEAQKVPARIAEKELKGIKLKKVTSGAHHTLVLASGRVFGWGDPETGKTGRMLKSRNKNSQSLEIEAIGLKNVVDIFWGLDASFAINETKNGAKHVYSWGLNNWGQLGLGHRENMSTPTEIKAFKDIDIKKIWGGAQHTIALTSNGEVYSWGKNEEGQLGIGDTYTEFSNKHREELIKIEEEEKVVNEELQKLFEEAKEKGDKATIRTLTASQKKSKKKYEKLREGEDNLENILYSTTPKKIEGLSNIFFIASGATFNYAIESWNKITREENSQENKMAIDEQKDNSIQKEPSNDPPNTSELIVESENKEPKSEEAEIKVDNEANKSQDAKMEEMKPSQDAVIEESKEKTEIVEQPPKEIVNSTNIEESKGSECKINKVYSWGIGNSYVLGTKDEETRFTPYSVASDMYKNLNPLSISCGTLHVVVRAITTDEKEEDFELDPSVHEVQPKLLEEAQKDESKLGKKRKHHEMEKDSNEGKILDYYLLIYYI